MKNNRILTLLMMVMCLSLSGCKDSGLSAYFFWKQNIQAPMSKADIVSIDGHILIRSNDPADSVNIPFRIVIEKGKNLYYIDSFIKRYYKFTNDTVFSIDMVYGEMMQGSADSAYYQERLNLVNMDHLDFLKFLEKDGPRYHWKSIHDTVINGINYKVLLNQISEKAEPNDSTQKHNTTITYLAYYYFNTQTRRLEKIFFPKWKETRILDITYPSSTQALDAIFNFNREEYKFFSHHNDKFLPYSYLYRGDLDELYEPDSSWDFPLVSLLTGDTTTIDQMDGWLFLNYWTFGCESCYEWMAQLKAEKDSLGYNILEKSGIRIVSINTLSDYAKHLHFVVDKYGLTDRTYSAPGIGKHWFEITGQSLVSPQKWAVASKDCFKDPNIVVALKNRFHNGYTADGPVIFFDTKTIDLGTIKKGSDVICDFSYTNYYVDLLYITSVTPSKGGKVLSWSKDASIRGEEKTIKVSVNTSQIGPLNVTFKVCTNDPMAKEIVLRVKGVVRP